MYEQMSSLTLHIVTGYAFGTEMVEGNQAHEVIYRHVTLALNEAEKRVFTLVAMTLILKQLPLPSKRRIDKASEDIRYIVQRIIDQRKKRSDQISSAKVCCLDFFRVFAPCMYQ